MNNFLPELARLFKLPDLVRKLLSILVAVVICFMPRFFFTTESAASVWMLPGDEAFDGDTGPGWTAGFGKTVVTPEDITADTYFIAGYYTNNPAAGVLDDMFARAVWLDDNTGRGGVVLCAVDCIGLSRADINDIRELVIRGGKVPGVKSINIAATHTHSAIDTQGLWGTDFYLSGRNKDYMKYLKERTADAIIAAYNDRRPGSLRIGSIETDDMQIDMRTPVDYSKTLTRIRFIPTDGSKPTYMVNYACHPELLGKNTKQVSADFPAYMGKEIERQTGGANFIFFNGAIGGMISSKGILEVYENPAFDCERYMMDYGKRVGEAVMSVDNETALSPVIHVKSQSVAVPCENTMLILARFLGVLNNNIARSGSRTSASILTEVSYMELGQEQAGLFFIPGELYPELITGNFLPAAESSLGLPAGYKVLSGMTGCEYQFVIGLCNDELGYIIPDNDYMLHEWLPYINIPKDSFGREHYEETNSTGPAAARAILEAMDSLIASVKK